MSVHRLHGHQASHHAAQSALRSALQQTRETDSWSQLCANFRDAACGRCAGICQVSGENQTLPEESCWRRGCSLCNSAEVLSVLHWLWLLLVQPATAGCLYSAPVTACNLFSHLSRVLDHSFI